MTGQKLLPASQLEGLIYSIRGQKVMLDADLARLYGVPTKALNQAVRRNRDRFPEDFAFQLTQSEAASLRSQIVTSSWGGRRYRPFAFTQEGVGALSGVLRSRRAATLYVEIMRAFVRQRALLAAYPELLRRLALLERGHAVHDARLRALFDAVREYLAPAHRPNRAVGFLPPKVKETSEKNSPTPRRTRRPSRGRNPRA